MDAFAVYRNKYLKNTLSINWVPWKDIGMAVDFNVADSLGIFKSIETYEAIHGFEEVLEKDITNVIIGKVNYEYLTNSINAVGIGVSDKIKRILDKKNKNEKYVKINENTFKNDINITFKGIDEKDMSQVEKQVGKIWVNVLGLKEIDIFDNFSEMGGDSILATQLLKELENEYGNLIDITDIFTYPTIRQMANYIEKEKGLIRNDKDDVVVNSEKSVEDILQRLAEGKISINEVEELMKTI